MLVSSPRTGEYLLAMKEGGVSAWRPIFDAFESRDDERIVAHCDPEIEWHTLWPGMERVFRGWAGVTRWRAAIDEALAGLSLQMEEAIQLGPDLFFLAYRLSARGRGGEALPKSAYPPGTSLSTSRRRIPNLS